jgi:endonuclease-8
MEGPSLFLAAEQLQPFVGKAILEVSGNTKIGKERLLNQKILEIFSFNKQLLFQFESFALRVHFMLYGSFEALVAGKRVTGDYARNYVPRLVMKFVNGEIKMFACSVKYINGENIKNSFDFGTDIMGPAWNNKKALAKIKEMQTDEICDVLMNQEIFGGVGNIIKNEVLFNTRTSPYESISNLSLEKISEIVKEARNFSQKFYEWRKVFQLKAHLRIYRKSICPICGGKVSRKKTGKGQRVSFFCPIDQPLKHPIDIF